MKTKQEAYIYCRQCGKAVKAQRTHNGICECWLGHCCGFGQDAMIGEEIIPDYQEEILNAK